MARTFLFRFDGSRDNDAFFAHAQANGTVHVYAGVELRLEKGWIPDFLEVSCTDEADKLSMTLIELEAEENQARISARKYLPESSSQIVQSFAQYLDNVLAKCRRTADPRTQVFEWLNDHLNNADEIFVCVCGAIRATADRVETIPLIDQSCSSPPMIQRQSRRVREFVFEGVRVLSPQDNKSLLRCILILDAVVRGLDHSAATLKNWRHSRTQPLLTTPHVSPENTPALHAFLNADTTRGLRTDCDELAKELSEFWSNTGARRFATSQVKSLVMKFFPIATALGNRELMDDVFEKARPIVSNSLGPVADLVAS